MYDGTFKKMSKAYVWLKLYEFYDYIACEIEAHIDEMSLVLKVDNVYIKRVILNFLFPL